MVKTLYRSQNHRSQKKMKSIKSKITTKEAAYFLNISVRMVQKEIINGHINAKKNNGRYVISLKMLSKYKKRAVGRPKK